MLSGNAAETGGSGARNHEALYLGTRCETTRSPVPARAGFRGQGQSMIAAAANEEELSVYRSIQVWGALPWIIAVVISVVYLVNISPGHSFRGDDFGAYVMHAANLVE